MKLSRRGFLGVLIGTAALTSSCSEVIDEMTEPELPAVLNPPGGIERHPIAHLLNRATFGPRPGQIAQVEDMGRDKWLERQLDYKSIDDDKLNWRLRRFDTIKFKPQDLVSFKSDEDSGYVAGELARVTLLKAVMSERQLYEKMVHFWSDHFSIFQFKDKTIAVLKVVDDREAIRPNALRKFKDLLRASAHSPAMLRYLDNTVNEKSHPNENYAREIMELHTLGVDGGYTEDDVQEVARCFTGWTMTGRGEFEYRGDIHDDGEKRVLGENIPAGGGKNDGDIVIDILARHPSTARFVCTKLVRHFVADDPPQTVIDGCVQTWQSTDGDIRDVLRTIFTHPEFDTALYKIKRPFEYLVSVLRALNADYDSSMDLVNRLDTLGQRPFTWIPPDGFPDYAEAWSSSILKYWNIGIDAARDQLPGAEINVWDIAEHVDVEGNADKMLTFFGRLLLKRDLNPVESQQLNQYLFGGRSRLDFDNEEDRDHMVHAIALLLSSPAFVYR